MLATATATGRVATGTAGGMNPPPKSRCRATGRVQIKPAPKLKYQAEGRLWQPSLVPSFS